MPFWNALAFDEVVYEHSKILSNSQMQNKTNEKLATNLCSHSTLNGLPPTKNESGRKIGNFEFLT